MVLYLEPLLCICKFWAHGFQIYSLRSYHILTVRWLYLKAKHAHHQFRHLYPPVSVKESEHDASHGSTNPCNTCRCHCSEWTWLVNFILVRGLRRFCDWSDCCGEVAARHPTCVIQSMIYNLCYPVHDIQPVSSSPWYTTCVIQPMIYNLCYPTHDIQPVLSNPWYTTCVIQPMIYNVCYPTHDIKRVLSSPWYTTCVIQPMIYNVCYPTHEIQPVLSSPW
jgi:hypothetical protein